MLLPILSYSQESFRVNVIDYVQELQKWDKKETNMALSWIIPEDYWRIVLKESNLATEQFIKEVETTFDGYFILAVSNADTGGLGQFSYDSKEEISKNLLVMDEDNQKYYPLKEDQIDFAIQNTLNIIKPFVAQTIGKLGESLSFFVFKNQKKNSSDKIFQTDKKGKIYIKHSGKSFVWNFPLASVIPPKYCPEDNQQMQGNWNYCPFHGKQLKNAANNVSTE